MYFSPPLTRAGVTLEKHQSLLGLLARCGGARATSEGHRLRCAGGWGMFAGEHRGGPHGAGKVSTASVKLHGLGERKTNVIRLHFCSWRNLWKILAPLVNKSISFTCTPALFKLLVLCRVSGRVIYYAGSLGMGTRFPVSLQLSQR